MRAESFLAGIFILSVVVAALSTFSLVASGVKNTGFIPTGNVVGGDFAASGGLWIIGLVIALVVAFFTLKNYRTKLQ